MWFWLVIAILGLAIGGLAVARSARDRLRGGSILGIAVAAVVVIEVLIRLDAISVDQGTQIMRFTVLALIAVAVSLIPWTGRSRGA